MTRSISDLFEKYPNIELTLVSILDIQIKKDPHYYKAVFEYTSPNNQVKYNPVAEIPPELFHKKYKIGAKFLNGVQIGYAEDIMVSSFKINNTVPLKTFKMLEVINSNDHQIVEQESRKQYFLKQNCFYVEYDDYDLIIPHYAIANHFHFRSASLRHVILDMPFTSLYEANSFKRDLLNPKKVQLKIKTYANKSDVITICGFLNDNHIRSSFEKYRYQKIDNPNYFHQIEAQFPFFSEFEIKTLCKQINTSGKMKIFVLGIYQDNYKYDFDEVDYFYENSHIVQTAINKPPQLIKERPKTNNGKIINKSPSAKYVINKEVFYENDFGDINEIRLNPICIGLNSNNPFVVEDVPKEVNGSYEKASNKGDENLQQKNLANEEKKELEVFSLEKFDILFESLANHHNVTAPIISDRIPLEPRKNKHDNIPTKYYILSNILRCYKYGSFLFKNKKIAFIEIEAGRNWKKISTWFFILKSDSTDFSTKNVNQIVFEYLCEEKKLDDIETELKEKNIIFLRKSHPNIKLANESVENWVKEVIKQLNDGLKLSEKDR